MNKKIFYTTLLVFFVAPLLAHSETVNCSGKVTDLYIGSGDYKFGGKFNPNLIDASFVDTPKNKYEWVNLDEPYEGGYAITRPLTMICDYGNRKKINIHLPDNTTKCALTKDGKGFCTTKPTTKLTIKKN